MSGDIGRCERIRTGAKKVYMRKTYESSTFSAYTAHIGEISLFLSNVRERRKMSLPVFGVLEERRLNRMSNVRRASGRTVARELSAGDGEYIARRRYRSSWRSSSPSPPPPPQLPPQEIGKKNCLSRPSRAADEQCVRVRQCGITVCTR